MEPLCFMVPGPVVGKQRARVTARGSYTPAKTVAYENLIALCATAALMGREWPLDAEYTLTLSAALSVVKSKKSARCGRPRKLDLDNVAKAVGDALNGIVWNDDCDVVWLDAAKRPLDGTKEDETLAVTVRVLRGS